jgi:hypothetical protein
LALQNRLVNKNKEGEINPELMNVVRREKKINVNRYREKPYSKTSLGRSKYVRRIVLKFILNTGLL